MSAIAPSTLGAMTVLLGANYLPVPRQVGQTIFLAPPQFGQALPFTFPLFLQMGQAIVFVP